MKAIGYLCTFSFLVLGGWATAHKAASYNIELALFLGAMIPIAMILLATLNGDMD